MSPQADASVTAADIARLAGVTRATVSNWRRRHAGFPAPSGGTESSPTYDLAAVRAWLKARGQLPEDSPADELRTALRAAPDSAGAAAALLPCTVAAADRTEAELAKLADASDADLLAWARAAATDPATAIPGAGPLPDTAAGAELARTLLRCLAADGRRAALGVAAEQLDAGSGGAHTTPEPLAGVMAELLGEAPETVLDPACGSGSLLAAAALAGAARLLGQELHPGLAALAAARVRPASAGAAVAVRSGDSLRDDAFAGETADAVLCVPPYGDRGWGHRELAYDQRWLFGLPPKGEPELAWIQHCISHLRPGGLAVLLLPPAVAARPSGRRIRAEMLRAGAVCAVIALPAGAAAPAHVGLHLWVLRRPAETDGHTPAPLLLADTAPLADEAAAGPGATAASGAAGIDWEALRAGILETWRLFGAGGDLGSAPVPARAAAVVDLLDDVIDLTPARHTALGAAPATPEEAAAGAREAGERLRGAAAEFARLTDGATWSPADGGPRDWRRATVDDLVRGGALHVLRATAPGRQAGGEREAAAPAGAAVLTEDDIARSGPASGGGSDLAGAEAVEIRAGDVLLPEIVRGGPVQARVAGADDAGCLLGRHILLLRPDPDRFHPWFLAGFLADRGNVRASTTGTSVVRIDPRRLRVPLLPAAEQQRYGAAFQRLHALRTAARRAAALAEETSQALGTSLAAGLLEPPQE
ncbi:N-6 DNA methylase [Streptomonospora sp. PA3]|uniref:N-6 DNA methylase n=1 Tax=Streptomonospora sp. PA3 TaxID=2607326 RepID=UPI0012DBD7D1|nr:N-6 DNA methylase [Streptomonospora sp. PA3]MUL41768.1 N-6 DNA methylase [Streptomonospora sp. PA3]